jgi:acyl-CoA synthetase (AMP-forming)/AMP-acid ligase II
VVRLAQWLVDPGTVGAPVLGELLILDGRGHSPARRAPTRDLVRGATNPGTSATLQRPRAAAARRRGQAVGDIGLSTRTVYRPTGRATVISGGVNIYPQETENLLATHPAVLDVAVFGVPSDDLGEEVKAVVQPAEPSAAGPELEAELIAFCRGRLAHFKCPRSVEFRDELPRLPTGKLYKRLLRDPYWAGRGPAASV